MKNIIKKIKPILKKEYYIREMMLLVVMSLSLVCFGIYESLAIFQSNVEKSSVARIIAGDINFTLTSTNTKYNSTTGQITVSAGTTEEVPLTITNTTPISAKYKLYYKLVSPTTLPEGVSIKVKSETEEGYDEGVLATNEEVTREISIENNSTSSVTLQIGVEKGYAHNELVLIGDNNNQLDVETIDTTPFFVDTSNANEPVLASGMIPVVYDDDNDVWLVANTQKGYYAYQDQIWANAVTVSDANYRTAAAGTPIPMDVINTMWVWIPRFKYKIPSNIGSSSNLTEPPQVDVVFETGTAATGVTETVYRNGIASDGTNTNYYTHPAFRNIENITYDSSTTSRGAWDEEITGFWVGKFETGNIANNPLIKPDITSLTSQNVSTHFLTSLTFGNGTMDTTTGEVTFSTNSNNIYGLNTKEATTDTHMMKNTEWGAVAILSQSQYGKMGNTNYEGTNKEIYINNSSNKYTGRSLGLPSPESSSSTTYGTYSYNDKTCSTDTSICSGEEKQYAGTGASTTGTIYGIYDMSGGKTEYIMGNWNKYSGSDSSNNSGFNGLYATLEPGESGSKEDGVSYPESKYYDLYQGTSSSSVTKEKSILGDATYETMKWYSDSNTFVSKNLPWFTRGSDCNSHSVAGVFNLYYGYGDPNYISTSFRSILIP